MNKITLQAIKFGLNTLAKFNPAFAAQIAYKLFITPQKTNYQPTSAQLEVIARGQKLNINGLCATVWGQGRTVLLHHGWQRSRHNMTGFVAPLLEQGFCVVALDAPAHGDSPGRRMSPFAYAQVVLETGRSIDHLEAIVAHSMGAFATIQALHLGLDVRSVVLLAPPSRSMMGNPMAFASAVGLNTATQKAFLEIMAAEGGMKVSELGLENFGHNLEARALFVHDPEDQRVPYKDSELTVAQWSKAQLLTVHKLGHGNILSDADVIEKAVQFIAKAETQDRKA
jgi:pimeloyl-ACP methyl ester carboxylesterase